MRKPPSDPLAPPYEVGYRKPPTETQFKKGRSGNPQGRPKKVSGDGLSLELMTLLTKAFNEKTAVNEGGKRRNLRKVEIMFKQLVNQAAGGNLKSGVELLKQLQTYERSAGGRAADADEATDQAVIESLSQRLAAPRASPPNPPQATATEDPSNEPDPPTTPGALR
ncbi:MAG: DUF5681 domain-containing protein [Methylibium sp.]|nr:DUF5681 domain-containing protein [Methylibium sp.]